MAKRPSQKNKKPTKDAIIFRYAIVIAALLLASFAIIAGLFETTIVHRAQWIEKARELDSNAEMQIKPIRGTIFADDGSMLAANVLHYNASIDFGTPLFKKDSLEKYLPALCDSLVKFKPQKRQRYNYTSREQWAETFKKYLERYEQSGRRIFTFYSNLTPQEFAKIRTFPFLKLSPRHTGLHKNSVVLRTKPYGSMASRSIGNIGVGRDNTDLEVRARSGLELALDSLLAGKPGKAKKNLGIGGAYTTYVPAIHGYDITTTINVTMQDIVEEELENMCTESNATWGTAVLMEVATGDIKAISNLQRNEDTGTYSESVNYAVMGFEPGSVVKPITMLLALEDGLVGDIDTPIPTGHSVFYEGRPISDHPGGPSLTPRQIIETSSNVGMSSIVTAGFTKDKGYAANPARFRERLEEIGFFEPMNTGIAGERIPQVARLGNTRADRVALTRMAYGYTTLIPPLRTLSIYNAIANDGKYVRPRLVTKISRDGEPDSIVPVTYIREQICDPINAKKLRIMLRDVVWGEKGTARNYVKDDFVEIAGKTGTCYETQAKKYTTVRRLAFCGFFPYENPRYSCIVVMRGADQGAASRSGVVLKNIARRLYAHGYLKLKPQAKIVENPAPAVFAAGNKDKANSTKSNYNISKTNSYKQPAQPASGVPNVVGLNAREAIKTLEASGLKVVVHGAGYVANQSITPGSKIVKGQTIILSLHI